VLRFYSNGPAIVGRWLLLLGLALVGLGILVFIFREILAALAAAILVVTGVGMCLTAARMFWNARQMNRNSPDPEQAYRKNVRIRGGQEDGSL